MRPNIDTHDYDVKMRNAIRFLDDDDKVKVTMRFRFLQDPRLWPLQISVPEESGGSPQEAEDGRRQGNQDATEHRHA